MQRLAFTAVIVSIVGLAGCDPKPGTPTAGGGTSKPPAAGADKSDHGHDHEHVNESPAKTDGDGHGHGHGGEVIELGTTKIGDLTVRASRDKGELKPGGDAPIDAWLTTSDGKPATVSAVRFWIGTEDAKGSVKAKADIEDPAQPNHWHTHAELPSPVPDGAKLWVEIEVGGQKSVGSLVLNP